MNAYRNYPAGYEPTAGPFLIHDNGNGKSNVCSDARSGRVIEFMHNDDWETEMDMTPAQAREKAAALIECADYIERNAMTTEDVARETRNRT